MKEESEVTISSLRQILLDLQSGFDGVRKELQQVYYLLQQICRDLDADDSDAEGASGEEG